MLFHVRMDVQIPPGADPAHVDTLKASERARCQELMRAGIWRHLWRIAGRYSNFSLFNTGSIAELHEILSTLPLFPYMQVEVTPLCRHPSSIREDDR